MAGPLRSPKHESFARAIFEGLSEDNAVWRAYVKAGYTRHEPSARADSARLLRMVPEIVARVRKFQQEAAKQAGETVERVTNELNEIISDARQDRAHGAAISGVGLKSKILGLVVERTEVGKAGDFTEAKSTKDMARQELIGLGLANPTEQDIAMAVEALRRLTASLDAIVSGKDQTTPDPVTLTNAAATSVTQRH
jgi:hypothetical protein